MSEASSGASALIETSRGPIRLRLFDTLAPVTVANFTLSLPDNTAAKLSA